MQVMVNGKWVDGFLDAYRGPGAVRIAVRVEVALPRIAGLYFEPSRSVSLVWDYARRFGWRRVWRKIRSRLAETARNDKHVRVGLGEVIEAGASNAHRQGSLVVYVAPCHPRATDTLVTSAKLLRVAAPALQAKAVPGWLLRADLPETPGEFGPPIAGWQPQSGVNLDDAICAAALDRAERLLAQMPQEAFSRWQLPTAAVRTFQPATGTAPAGKLKAVLVGLGHHAKTNILPNLHPEIALAAVHELDPLQLGMPHRGTCSYSTAPDVHPEADVVFIAGYHHTHATLAAKALRGGAAVVMEKPLATTREQLDQLLAALGDGPSRLHVGFHKRYAPTMQWALADLGVSPGDAVNCHAIVSPPVLPPLHWYRWPNSRSRIVTNGCHWIDQFLNLNAFAPVVGHSAWQAANRDIVCTVELANGACLLLVLTGCGSHWRGVRDHVELRAGRGTVQITGGLNYAAECADGRQKRRRVRGFDPFAAMYASICQRILDGTPGEPKEALAAGAGLVIALDEALQRSRAESNVPGAAKIRHAKAHQSASA